MDVTCSGPSPLFNQDEEALLVEHVKTMANLGYGYARSEVVSLASKFAVDIGKREEGSGELSMPWYYNFVKRWPELHSVKPQSLSELRARAASKDNIDTYYEELDRILTLYKLKDKPYCIYNVDEKCVIIGAGKIPNIVAPKGCKAQTVTSERGQNVTVMRNYFLYTKIKHKTMRKYLFIKMTKILASLHILIFLFILPSMGPLISGQPELSNLPY